jgi:hypothetical protein
MMHYVPPFFKSAYSDDFVAWLLYILQEKHFRNYSEKMGLNVIEYT